MCRKREKAACWQVYSIVTDFYQQLEDLYLKYTDTEVYNDLVTKVRQSRSARNRFIKDFVPLMRNCAAGLG